MGVLCELEDHIQRSEDQCMKDPLKDNSSDTLRLAVTKKTHRRIPYEGAPVG